MQASRVQIEVVEASTGAFVPVAEAARVLGVDRNAVYRMAKSGAIPAVIDGRRVRILRRGLFELIDGKPGGVDARELRRAVIAGQIAMLTGQRAQIDAQIEALNREMEG